MYQAFLERAEIEVDFVRSEDGRLKAEQETLERRLSKIKHRRQLISDVDARLRSYAPSSEHCPVCHIRATAQIPVPSGGKSDFFACSHCGVSIEVKL